MLVYGETEFVYPNKKNYLGYYRKDLTKQFFIEINLVKDKTKRYHDTSNYKLIYSNMKYHLNELSGYEVNVYLI